MYLIHLEYKIRGHKWNKNRSEMGGVLKIKATLQIQKGKTQGFYQSLLNVDDWFNLKRREKPEQNGELEAGRWR